MSIYLADNKLRSIQRLGHSLLDYETDAELRSAALRGLEPIFLSHASNFYMTRNLDGRWVTDDIVTYGLTGDMHQIYGQRYFRQDPFYGLFPHPGRAVTDVDVIDWTRYLKSEYFNDFLRPQGIHHQMNIWVPCEEGLYGVLALFRPRGETAFVKEDRLLYEFASSLISGALRKAYHQKSHHEMQRVARVLANETPFKGVLVVDDKLRVVCRNQEANEIMATAKNATISPSGEPDASSLPIEIVLACLEVREKAEKGRPHSKCLQLELKEPLGVMDVAVRLVELEPDSLLFFVMFGKPRVSGNWFRLLKAKHVSRREMDVVKCLLEGLTNKEIGQRLFISEYTVENHLKSIYRKMDVKNRTSLVRQLVHPPV